MDRVFHATGSRLSGRALPARLSSSVATLAIHAAVLFAITGSIRVSVPPTLPPVGVQLIGSLEYAAAAVVDAAVPEPDTIADIPIPKAIDLPRMAPPDIEPIAADSFKDGREASAADAGELARLQGVYLGQIQGRIHRALQTLADSIALPSPCNAKVVQDERGRVLDIDLAECALAAEQQQLVQAAIRRASPLPRPPHGLAMGSYLTLNLSSISR